MREQPGPYDNVGVGTMLWTLVEPHAGHEVDYNRWYERDHFYAGCMIGAGWFAGKRWVATGDLKDLRFPAASGFLPGHERDGSYLATYWVQRGEDAEAIAWGSRQVHWLHENDRMYPHRDHVHTLMYVHRWAVDREADGIPPLALCLDHPWRGLACLTVDRPEGSDARELSAWLADEALPGAIEGTPVAKVAGFTAIPLPDDAPVTQPVNPNMDRRMLLLAFLDDEPASAWPAVQALADAVASSQRAEVSWAAPFLPTIPGTDTYTDEL